MHSIVQIVQILIWLLCVPVLIGSGIQIWIKEKPQLTTAYLFGMFYEWALFEIIAVPAIYFRISFQKTMMLWIGCMFISCIAVLLRFLGKTVFKTFGIMCQEAAANLWGDNWKYRAIVLGTVVCILIQMGAYVFGMNRDDDDSRYIANAVATCERNTMLLTNPFTGEALERPQGELLKDSVAPWMIYLALLSKLVCMHPAVLAHTVFPVFLILLGYAAYIFLAQSLFEDKKQKQIVFVFLCAILTMFTTTSKYASATFFLTRIWQGKSVVAGVMIPFLYAYLMHFFDQPKEIKRYVVLAIVNSACCLLSGVGIVVAGMLTGALLFSYAVQKRMPSIVLCGIIACIPNLIMGILYIGV